MCDVGHLNNNQAQIDTLELFLVVSQEMHINLHYTRLNFGKIDSFAIAFLVHVVDVNL